MAAPPGGLEYRGSFRTWEQVYADITRLRDEPFIPGGDPFSQARELHHLAWSAYTRPSEDYVGYWYDADGNPHAMVAPSDLTPPPDPFEHYLEGHRFYYNNDTGTYETPPELSAHQIHLLLDRHPTVGGGMPGPFDPEDPNQYCAFHDCGGGYLFGFLPVGTLAALGVTASIVAPFAFAPTMAAAVGGVSGSLAGGAVGREVGGAVGGETGEIVGGLLGSLGGGAGGMAAANIYFPAPATAGTGDLGTLSGTSGDTLLAGEASRDTLSGDLGTAAIETAADMAETTSVDPVYFGFDVPLNPGASGFEPYTIASDFVAGSPAPGLIPQLDFIPLQAGDLMHYTQPPASDWVPSLGDLGKALGVGKAALVLANAFGGSDSGPARAVTVAKPVAFRPAEHPGSLGGWYDSGPVLADPVPAAALPVSDSGGAGLLLIPAAIGGLLYYTLSTR